MLLLLPKTSFPLFFLRPLPTCLLPFSHTGMEGRETVHKKVFPPPLLLLLQATKITFFNFFFRERRRRRRSLFLRRGERGGRGKGRKKENRRRLMKTSKFLLLLFSTAASASPNHSFPLRRHSHSNGEKEFLSQLLTHRQLPSNSREKAFSCFRRRRRAKEEEERGRDRFNYISACAKKSIRGKMEVAGKRKTESISFPPLRRKRKKYCFPFPSYLERIFLSEGRGGEKSVFSNNSTLPVFPIADDGKKEKKGCPEVEGSCLPGKRGEGRTEKKKKKLEKTPSAAETKGAKKAKEVNCESAFGRRESRNGICHTLSYIFFLMSCQWETQFLNVRAIFGKCCRMPFPFISGVSSSSFAIFFQEKLEPRREKKKKWEMMKGKKKRLNSK